VFYGDAFFGAYLGKGGEDVRINLDEKRLDGGVRVLHASTGDLTACLHFCNLLGGKFCDDGIQLDVLIRSAF
jgi:hypothetical protein